MQYLANFLISKMYSRHYDDFHIYFCYIAAVFFDFSLEESQLQLFYPYHIRDRSARNFEF